MARILRRTFNTGLMAAACAGFIGVAGANAQSYPSGEVHLICAFGAGTSSDATTRFFGEKLKTVLGQTVIVENKTGAGGNVATEYTARAAPDGLTVLLAPVSVIAANQHIMKQPTVDPLKELQVVAGIDTSGMMLAVKKDSPYKTLAEFTAAMKEKGDKATYGFATGGAVKVAASLYLARAGLDKAVEVTYKSSPDTLVDLEKGVLDWVIVPGGFAVSQDKQGRLKVLAVSTAERLDSAPDYPTMKESGLDVDLSGWVAAIVPSGTPKDVVDKLAKAFADVMAMDDVKKFLIDTGSSPRYLPPEKGQALMAKDIEAWGEFVSLAKIEKR